MQARAAATPLKRYCSHRHKRVLVQFLTHHEGYGRLASSVWRHFSCFRVQIPSLQTCVTFSLRSSADAPLSAATTRSASSRTSSACRGDLRPNCRRYLRTPHSCCMLPHSFLRPPQILDPGAAARGKIKKHLKKQVRLFVVLMVLALLP